LTRVNAGIPGLDKVLVPIRALKVRVCEYGDGFQPANQLIGSGLVRGPTAATFEEESNRLVRYVEPPSGGLIGSQGPTTTILLTFVNETQQVEVEVEGGFISNLDKYFEFSTNGVFLAIATAAWDDELTHDSATTPLGPPGPTG